MTQASFAINPFFAARVQRAVQVPQDRLDKPIYAKLPTAPINASPVPHLTSLYHKPEAGNYGSRAYPGNCGGNLIKDLLQYFQPKLVFDPMAGSGTCNDVCEELGIPCLSWDIHDGFDACDPASFSATETFDFIWAHPAYWRQKLYCVAKNVVWCPPRLPLGRGGTAQSGSHIIIASAALCDGAPPKLVGPVRGSGSAKCHKIENRRFDGDAGL